MNRLLLILSIVLVICTTTVIFALLDPNEFGDTINRDAMTEHRLIDPEDDAFFMNG